MNQLYLFENNIAAPVSEHLYESEASLQDIVTQNPHLLLEPNSNKKLFLLQPEFTLPEYQGASNTFSLDHLMVDSDGIPALVEIKRSTDTRIRREVVAQMIDYAARMISVKASDLRECFRQHNVDADILEYYDTDDFWDKVATNLQMERLSLYFVADAIPDTLLTMMDFMRRTMESIAIYGVEIKQYQSAGTTLLSSSWVGGYQPEPIKLETPSVEWDAISFAAQLQVLQDDALPAVSKNMQSDCTNLGYSIVFGRGAKQPTFRDVIDGTTVFQVAIHPFSNPPKSAIEICLPAILHALPQFTEDDLRTLFCDYPDKEQALQNKEIRNTSQYLYCNLSYFKNAETYQRFIEKLAAIRDAFAQK